MVELSALLYSYINFTTVLLGLFVFLVVGYLTCMRERSGIPPGPPFLPILGNLYDIGVKYQGKKHKYFEELKNKYGSVIRIYFGSQLLIIFNDFDSIDEAFVKQKDIFSIRPTEKLWAINRNAEDAVGIVWSNGQKWKSTRRNAIQTLRDLGVGKTKLEEQIKEETDFIIESFSKSNVKPFTVRDVLLRATTNIISVVTFGKRYDYNDEELLELLGVIEAGFKSEGPFSPINEFPSLRFLSSVAPMLLALQSSVARVNQLITKNVEEHRQTFNKENIRDLIDAAIINKENSDVDEENMKIAVLDMFIAGSETTTNTLDWAVLYMILNPHIQEKCQYEIDDIVGSSRKVNWSDKCQLPYVEATLLEVQRLGCAVPLSLPHTTSKDTVVKGFVIPEGSLICANIHACHLDGSRWKDPLTFNPDRFLDEDGKVKQPPDLIPFSTGPRICPGASLARMELFLFFTGVLQRFHLTISGDAKPSVDGVCGMTLSPAPYTLLANPRI